MTVLAPQEPAREWAAHEVMVTDPPIIRKAIGAAAIGNITEWYDFGVYAYFEPTIKKVFFSDLVTPPAPSPPSGCSPSRSWSGRSAAVLRPAGRPDRPQPVWLPP